VRPADRRAEIHAYGDDAEEADAIADACWREFTGGVAWHRMAVLFRTNAQSALFESALARRGVPFRLPGAQRFAARPAVRVLLDRLRDADRNLPGRPFSQHLSDLAADVDEEPGVDDPGAASPTAGDVATRPHDIASHDELRTHRDALLRFGRQYLALENGPGSVAGFVSWLDLATRGESTDERGVDLVTFHRAKGLEWQVVFVTGLERGLVPISWATTPAARAEERRFLHVALGRAADWVHCSWARERTAHGRRVPREPTPWLAELERAAGSSHVEPVDPKARLGQALATLQRTKPPAPTSHARRLAR
jgi:DNA helicase-2/ATP-dependent DNA helicase PcrA